MLPKTDDGGGPCGVKEWADEGGGPAGVVDGLAPGVPKRRLCPFAAGVPKSWLWAFAALLLRLFVAGVPTKSEGRALAPGEPGPAGRVEVLDEKGTLKPDMADSCVVAQARAKAQDESGQGPGLAAVAAGQDEAVQCWGS